MPDREKGQSRIGAPAGADGLPPAAKVLLPVAVVAVSFGGVFTRLAGEAPPFTIAFLRLAFASALLTPAYLTIGARGELRAVGDGYRVPMLLGSGLFLALHFASWICSIFYTSVASSVLLVSTHPIFVSILGWLLLRERVTPRAVVGIGLGLGGSALLAYGDSGVGEANLLGDSLALVGGLGAACYFLVGRSLRQTGRLIGYVYPVYVTAAALLGLLCLAAKTPVFGFSASAYGWILAMAVVCQVAGHTLLNWSLRFVKAYVVAAAVLAEPIGAAALAYLILHEPPPSHFFLGAPFVLLGIFVAASAESRPKVA